MINQQRYLRGLYLSPNKAILKAFLMTQGVTLPGKRLPPVIHGEKVIGEATREEIVVFIAWQIMVKRRNLYLENQPPINKLSPEEMGQQHKQQMRFHDSLCMLKQMFWVIIKQRIPEAKEGQIIGLREGYQIVSTPQIRLEL